MSQSGPALLSYKMALMKPRVGWSIIDTSGPIVFRSNLNQHLIDTLRARKPHIQEKLLEVVLYVLKNKPYLKATDYSHDDMLEVIELLLKATGKQILSRRKAFFSVLHKHSFFAYAQNLKGVFDMALFACDRIAFQDFLAHVDLIPNGLLMYYSHQFNPATIASIQSLDLFTRLEPSQYVDKPWNALTSYEKLYHIVFNKIFTKALSHRLSLVGSLIKGWQGRTYSELGLTQKYSKENSLDLEANQDIYSLIQFKKAILLFQLQYKGPHSDILNQAIQEILEMPLPKVMSYRYSKYDKKNHPYIFSLMDEHTVTGYHSTEGYYYQINMGYLSGKKPGVKIFKVSSEQLDRLHSELDNLQYASTTNHFVQLPDLCQLKQVGYLRLPSQYSGNCTYESLKGLLLALLYDRLQKEHFPSLAAQHAFRIYKPFLMYDALASIDEYKAYALSPSPYILAKAKRVLPLYIRHQVKNGRDFTYEPHARQENNKPSRHKRKRKQSSDTI